MNCNVRASLIEIKRIADAKERSQLAQMEHAHRDNR